MTAIYFWRLKWHARVCNVNTCNVCVWMCDAFCRSIEGHRRRGPSFAFCWHTDVESFMVNMAIRRNGNIVRRQQYCSNFEGEKYSSGVCSLSPYHLSRYSLTIKSTAVVRCFSISVPLTKYKCFGITALLVAWHEFLFFFFETTNQCPAASPQVVLRLHQ